MIRVLFPIALLVSSWPTLARPVEVPLTFDFPFLREILLSQLYTDPDRTAQVWQGEGGCGELLLSDPQVDSQEGYLRVRSIAHARLATAVAGRCLEWFNWQGLLEIFNEPSLDAEQRRLAFRVVESNLYRPDGDSESISTQLWDRIKHQVHPRLARVHIDLRSPLQTLEETLPLLVPSPNSDQATDLAISVMPVAVRVKEKGLELNLRLALPRRPPESAVILDEPALSAQELARWETAWQSWDAFLTHVIKQAANDTSLAALRLALLEVLLDARHHLVSAALIQPIAEQPDPVRAVFLRTWERLDPVLRQLSAELPREGALRYLSFIAAADALRAIDALGPQVGVEISAAGLRRLARILAPQSSVDPLDYGTAVDPELRQLFGFGRPLKLRRPRGIDLSEWILPTARAAGPSIDELAARLDRWVPSPAELHAYLPLVHTLLERVAQDILDSPKLPPEHRSLYRQLVLATAWQESCWRQFIRKQGRVEALRSSAGSVGIMQINVRVWRGFYDSQALKADIAYNANAGGEILAHYLVDYAIKKGEHTQTGRLEDLARATYAVYNGGPSHLQRYRQAKTPKTLKDIDSAFLAKYRTVAQGDELAVASCYGL